MGVAYYKGVALVACESNISWVNVTNELILDPYSMTVNELRSALKARNEYAVTDDKLRKPELQVKLDKVLVKLSDLSGHPAEKKKTKGLVLGSEIFKRPLALAAIEGDGSQQFTLFVTESHVQSQSSITVMQVEVQGVSLIGTVCQKVSVKYSGLYGICVSDSCLYVSADNKMEAFGNFAWKNVTTKCGVKQLYSM